MNDHVGNEENIYQYKNKIDSLNTDKNIKKNKIFKTENIKYLKTSDEDNNKKENSKINYLGKKRKNADDLENKNKESYREENIKFLENKKIEDQRNANLIEILLLIKNSTKAEKYEKLGKGGFGTVYKFTKPDQSRFVVKLIFTDELLNEKNKKFQKNKKMLNNEVHYSMMMSNRNIVKGFSKICSQKLKINAILYKYAENYDLSYIIDLAFSNKLFRSGFNEKEGKHFNEYLRKPNKYFIHFFIIGILNGLRYLRDCNMAHLDLKASNVFIDKNFCPKLGDFFTIQTTNDIGDIPSVGTQNCMSPEWINDLKHLITKQNLEKLDIYALGCLFYKFLFKKDYLSNKYFEVNNKINMELYRERYENLKLENMDPIYKEFLLGLLHPNINERFDIDQIYKTDFIKNIPEKNYYTDMNLNDSIKYLLEIQKIEYSDFLQKRNEEKKILSNEEIENNLEIIEDFEDYDF